MKSSILYLMHLVGRIEMQKSRSSLENIWVWDVHHQKKQAVAINNQYSIKQWKTHTRILRLHNKLFTGLRNKTLDNWQWFWKEVLFKQKPQLHQFPFIYLFCVFFTSIPLRHFWPYSRAECKYRRQETRVWSGAASLILGQFCTLNSGRA